MRLSHLINITYIHTYLLTLLRPLAFTSGARQYGAVIRQGAGGAVTALTPPPAGGRWTVETADGRRLEAARVVNAAGLWAREIGRLTGLDLPLVPVQHQVRPPTSSVRCGNSIFARSYSRRCRRNNGWKVGDLAWGECRSPSIPVSSHPRFTRFLPSSSFRYLKLGGLGSATISHTGFTNDFWSRVGQNFSIRSVFGRA